MFKERIQIRDLIIVDRISGFVRIYAYLVVFIVFVKGTRFCDCLWLHIVGCAFFKSINTGYNTCIVIYFCSCMPYRSQQIHIYHMLIWPSSGHHVSMRMIMMMTMTMTMMMKMMTVTTIINETDDYRNG